MLISLYVFLILHLLLQFTTSSLVNHESKGMQVMRRNSRDMVKLFFKGGEVISKGKTREGKTKVRIPIAIELNKNKS